MPDSKAYVGIDNETNGGMTGIAKIIRDAWVFGIIPETETCAGWRAGPLEDLWRKVEAAWQRHGFLVDALPDDVKARFLRIHDDAVDRARRDGWSGEDELTGDD